MKKLKKGLTMPAHKLANYKHDKYDPDLQKSVQQLQEAKQARRDTGEDEEDEDEDDDEDEDEDEDGEESEPKAAGGNGQPALVENFCMLFFLDWSLCLLVTTAQEPLDRLRVKLQARIAELREARMPLKGDHKLLLLQRQEKKQRKKLEKKAKSSKLAAKKRTYQPPTANPFAGMTAEVASCVSPPPFFTTYIGYYSKLRRAKRQAYSLANSSLASVAGTPLPTGRRRTNTRD